MRLKLDQDKCAGHRRSRPAAAREIGGGNGCGARLILMTLVTARRKAAHFAAHGAQLGEAERIMRGFSRNSSSGSGPGQPSVGS